MRNLPEPDQFAWRKSSRSQASGECIEVAGGVGGVRDSKNVGGPVLMVGTTGLRALVAELKGGGPGQ
ncbi:DUF397 domain-containing protein [Actinokineospora sp.]|uniref:DUF397 domain-containing protein n=1 Tax=Actinokineospora sp. TaxID=1872133 RepID=UPI004037F255